ncbi:hypothetical protein QUW44_00415 [Limosilactobacillus pontis]|uniref:Uncharacterized protein n=1 Tax=Limosilactobacillus pontis TaxID=35787 RepID=A0ABT7UVB7_9LACO|nr:hypothetical protein [Limosilactobacillus pontis]MDM8265638.1 hypothetical protein [Limosilactobacillus pontis]
MTTEELIKKLKENKRVDVVVITALDGVKKLVILNDMSNPLFRLPTTATNWLELEVVDSQLIADSLGKESREYVAEQISEYLDTPVKDRFPEKKYRLVANPNSLEETGTYASKYVACIDDSMDSFSFVYGGPTIFSEKDLKQIEESHPNIAPAIDAMKVEVKGDAC